MIEYKIIENNEENPLESKILMSGQTTEFTLKQVDDHLRMLTSQKAQYEGQETAYAGQCVLLENRHPEYKDIHEDDYDMLHAYLEKKIALREIKRFLDDVNAQMAKYEADLIDIEAATGLKIPRAVPSPFAGPQKADEGSVEIPEADLEEKPIDNSNV